MSMGIIYDERNEKKTLTRLYKNEVVQHCSVCADLRLPTDTPAQGLDNRLEDILEAAQRGCSFCALVSRSSRRHQRVFNSIPWNRVKRTILVATPGKVIQTEYNMQPSPRNLPLKCAHLDSVAPIGLRPLHTDMIKTKSGRYRKLAKIVISTRIKHRLRCLPETC
jgi:hypothetical protein